MVNFDVSAEKETHVHRIGRTGRAGEEGDAYSFLLDTETHKIRGIVDSMKLCGQNVPDELMTKARDALCGLATAWS